MNLSVSIIIPAYNSAKTIFTCLEEALKAIDPQDEIIVVDDASTDDTEKIALNYNCKVKSLSQNRGPGFARNFGAGVAQNELLIFLDSDIVLKKETIEKMKQYFSHHPDCHTLTLNLDSTQKTFGFFSDYKNLYMDHMLSSGELEVNYVYGACCATRSRGFIPWPTTIRMTEDAAWGYRQKKLGLKIHCLKELRVTHLKEYNLISLIRYDFLISSFFARSFLKNNRWNTLYTSEKFGHTLKGQKISIVTIFCILSLSAFSSSWMWAGGGLWFIANLHFFSFLKKKRNLPFLMGAIVWTFLDHIVYLMGILYGVFLFARRGDLFSQAEEEQFEEIC